MIIAVVDNYKITDSEYHVELVRMMKNMHLNQPDTVCKNRAIEYLIDGVLLLQSARSADLSVKPDEVQNELIEMMLEYQTEDDFKQMLGRRGLDLEKIKLRIHDNILEEKYIQEVFHYSDEEIPDEQLEKFYRDNEDKFQTPERIRVSHILISNQSETAMRKLEEIRKKVKSPTDFADFARKLSQCPSCECYGDLGFIPRGKMVQEFEDVAFSLDPYEVSQPVRTVFGWHLIMTTDRQSSHQADFQTIKQALGNRLKRIEAELRLIRKLKQLRTQAKVRVYEERL